MDNETFARLAAKTTELENIWAKVRVQLEEMDNKSRVLAAPYKIPEHLRSKVMTLRHDLRHTKRAIKVAEHKHTTTRDHFLSAPNVVAAERALDQALAVFARIGKDVVELNRALDEVLAACAPSSTRTKKR